MPVWPVAITRATTLFESVFDITEIWTNCGDVTYFSAKNTNRLRPIWNLLKVEAGEYRHMANSFRNDRLAE
jgi:hypothetical protein